MAQRPRSYAELHCHSYFSFLNGSSSPEEIVTRAHELGYHSIALTDIDGVHGVARAHATAKSLGMRLVIGAQLTVLDDIAPLPNTAQRVVLLAQTHLGYSNLCRLITLGRTRCNKGSSWVSWDEVSRHTKGLIVLSGALEGPIDSAWRRNDLHTALHWARRLKETFPGRAYLELTHHFAPGDDQRVLALTHLASNVELPCVLTQDIRFATPSAKPLYDVQTCIRHKCTLNNAGHLLSFNGERYLRTRDQLAAHFIHFPEALANTTAIARQCLFSLDELRYRFPSYELPPDETAFSHLYRLTSDGARNRYRPMSPRAAAQIAHELAIIEKLNLAGYFLIVWDIVRFCRENKILCQGRGSAANSAVCYALGITAVDPVRMELLFERFLSEERDEMPDIDLDIASDRREEVIQYVYRRFGPHRVALSCNVITYHARSAVRDIGKVLGLSLPQLDRAAKAMDYHATDLSPQNTPTRSYKNTPPRTLRQSTGLAAQDSTVQTLFSLAQQFEDVPRHLGIHPGGMVIAESNMHEVVPMENATMDRRTVVQWDKDDLSSLGIIKIDLLGLGMLTAIDKSLALIEEHQDTKIDLGQLPTSDPEVYDMICRADTVGVFQIESRAQMNMLPRLRPRTFYDLVIEVAIIRPGPIQGEMIHPYLRRRTGAEPVEYEHESLEPVLRRTLGVPLFQEQGMKLAIAAAGFTPAEADELRRAMGHKRSRKRMATLEKRLIEGMSANQIPQEVSERIFKQLCAFADYGFPESHSASFALIVYASCFLKHYYPAAFLAGLLNAQPMGFYSPNTLVADAKRHGVQIQGPCIKHSRWESTLEGCRKTPHVRLGIQEVRGLGDKHREAYEREHPFHSLSDLSRRSGLPRSALARLAAAGGFSAFGHSRREALWRLASLPVHFGSAPLLDPLEEQTPDREQVSFAEMSSGEELLADYGSLGLSTLHHPMDLFRPQAKSLGLLSARALNKRGRNGQRARIAGMVIARQRPGSAKGMMFMTIEDETGLANLVITPPIFERYQSIARTELLVLAHGAIERQGDVVNVVVESLEKLPISAPDSPRSRDFR